MRTKVSTNGYVTLPLSLRRQLGLRAGDSLEANIEGGRIVLTPHRTRPRQARIVKDSVTGLPVLLIEGKTPSLRSKEVAEILANRT